MDLEIDLTNDDQFEAAPKRRLRSDANTSAGDILDQSHLEDNPHRVTITSQQSTSTSSETNGTTASRKMKSKSVGSLDGKIKKRTDAALEREAKKQRVAAERAVKQAAREMNKIYKPGECMKYMTVEVHPVLHAAWYMSEAARDLQAAGARLAARPDIAEPGLLLWARGGQMKITSSVERCALALYVLEAREAAELVGARALAGRVAAVREMAGCRLTVAIFQVKDYFKSGGRKTTNGNKKLMTEIDLEMAVTDLLVSADCDAVVVNTPNELALLIVQLTKAIAEEPYKKSKRACDEQANFYMRGDNKNCVAVTDYGHGVNRLWQQMIAILPMSSLETSRALCAKYESPIELYEALQTSNGVNELADIGVARAAVPGSKARKIGPEFARKLKTLFTAEDGNVLLE